MYMIFLKKYQKFYSTIYQISNTFYILKKNYFYYMFLTYFKLVLLKKNSRKNKEEVHEFLKIYIKKIKHYIFLKLRGK